MWGQVLSHWTAVALWIPITAKLSCTKLGIHLSRSQYQRLNPKVEGLSPVDTIHGQNLAAGEQMDSTATDLKYMSSWLEQHIELTTDADPRYSVLFKFEWQGVYFVCDGISHDAKGTLLCLPKPFTGPFLPLNTRHSKPGICFSQVSICDGIRTTTGMQLLQKKRQLHRLF